MIDFREKKNVDSGPATGIYHSDENIDDNGG
jgi:hypothetical protein